MVIQPLADGSVVSNFALDNVAIHGGNVTVVWDPSAQRWSHLGCDGLCVWINGTLTAHSHELSRLEVML